MAVVIKNNGYSNVKIYNGGLKEWIDSGLEVESHEVLPEYETRFYTAEELKEQIDLAGKTKCLSAKGAPFLTLLDLRTERVPEGGALPLLIRSSCNTVSGLLDDLQQDDFRKKIPIDTPVFVITETGNRDDFAVKYLSKFGYTKVYGLKFGMRGWIKADFPTVSQEAE